MSNGPQYTETSKHQIEVTENGDIQIRRADRVFKNGKEIAKSYHRHVLAPGTNLSNEIKLVKDIAALVWTPEVIAAHQARIKPKAP